MLSAYTLLPLVWLYVQDECSLKNQVLVMARGAVDVVTLHWDGTNWREVVDCLILGFCC